MTRKVPQVALVEIEIRPTKAAELRCPQAGRGKGHQRCLCPQSVCRLDDGCDLMRRGNVNANLQLARPSPLPLSLRLRRSSRTGLRAIQPRSCASAMIEPRDLTIPMAIAVDLPSSISRTLKALINATLRVDSFVAPIRGRIWRLACWLYCLRVDASIDGKTSRRTHDRSKGRKPLHLVSAWASRQRLVRCDGHSGRDRREDRRKGGRLLPRAQGEPGIAEKARMLHGNRGVSGCRDQSTVPASALAR